MASVLDLIKHYQHAIEKYPNDEQKILKCIDKLFQLDVTVQHLQETGVGRTVNALRKEPGDIGQASRALVYKWKVMVAAEESDHEGDHKNDTSKYNGHISERDSEDSTPKSKDRHDQYEKTKSNKSSADDQKHKHMNGDNSSSKRRHQSSEEEEPEIKKSKHSSSSDDKYKRKQIKHESSESDTEDSDNSQSDGSESDVSQSSEEHNKPKHKVKEEKQEQDKSSHSLKNNTHTSHSSHRSRKSDSASEKGHESSDKHSKHRSEARKSEKSSSLEKSSSSHKHSNTKDKESSSNKREKSSHKSVEKEKKTSESSSKHSDSSKKESSNKTDKHKNSTEKYSSSSEKHNSSNEKSEKKEKSSRKESTRERQKSKESSSNKHSSSSKDRSSKDRSKDKHSSSKESNHSHKTDKKHSSDSKKDKHKREIEKSGDDKKKHSSSKSSNSSSSKSKEDIPKIKAHVSSEESGDDGIDCGSGASFAEALGMISPTKPKKKSSTVKDFQSPNLFPDLSPGSLLAPTAKLAPLPALEISALPEISPNYKPRPPPKLLPHFTDEDAMSHSISSKNQRTKVYSGNKVIGKITTLYEMCVHVLQEHIDALEYTGGVPYEILKPVVDMATPQQLFMLEHFNPYLMEDTDHLWQKFCEKHFRNKQRQEMETWREMYMRCQEEQEHKLKSLTANIKQTQEAKKAPIKQTKMAYVDTIVKPPRNVLRKQAQHGTAHASTASPAARVASLASAPNVLRGGSVRPPPATPVSSSAFNKPKKAPLMQKALQFMRGRKR